MFEILCQNPEIHSFLCNFSVNYWKTVLKAVSLYGIREIYSNHLPITQKTIEEILSPNLKETLSSMKNELKNLNSAIKRIERRTQSSSDLSRDFNLTCNEKPKLQIFESKGKNMEMGSKRKSSEVKKLGIICEVREPRVCCLSDAQRIIMNVKAAAGEVDLNHDIFRSRASHSTQDSSPKGVKAKQTTANFTFAV